MQGSQHENQPGRNAQLQSAQQRKYVIIFILKVALGIILLMLGGLAVKNTRGQTDTFGPPYFIGAFIVGVALILAGFLDILLCRKVNSHSADSVVQKEVSTYTCVEIGFSVLALMGGFIGLFFVGIFGVPECDPRDFFSHCNYTENISNNRSIAIAILIFLLLSEIVVIGSVIMHCRACRGLGPYNAYRPPAHYGFTAQHQTYTTGGPANFVITNAPERPHYSGGRYGYHGRNYDSYSRDTQIIVGGQVIDTGIGGFEGAVLSQPESVTIVHPPVGYQQYTDQSGQTAGAQGYQTSGNVSDLQEQNRLLREQLALQQEQLNLMQQQQQARSPSPNLPPPPSYDSCIQDPVKISLLEEQNRELQNKCYAQQQQLHGMSSPDGENVQPSAPPM